jgi:hypothetical protein
MKGIQAQHQSTNQSLSQSNLSTLKMYTKSESETLVYLNNLTRLLARKDFTELRKARNRRILHMPMEWMNEIIIYSPDSFVDIRSVDAGTKIVKHN